MMRITRTAGWIVLIAVLFLLVWFVRSELRVSSPPQAAAQTPTESYPGPQVSEQVVAQYPPPFRPTEATYVPPSEEPIQTIASYPGPFPSITPEPTYTLVPGPTLTPFHLLELPKDASGTLTYLTYGDESSTVINQQSMDSQGNPGAQVDTIPVDVIGPQEVDFTKQFVLYAPDGKKAVLFHNLVNDPFNTDRYLFDLTSGKLENLQSDFEIYDFYSWYPDGQLLLLNHNSDVLMKLDSTTGKNTVLASPQLGSIHGAALSPDGSQLVFANNHFGLYVVDQYGQNQRQIYESELSIDGLAWSTDGKRIAFREDGWFTINPDGSDLRKFADSHFPPGFRPTAIWSPDSKYLIVPVIPPGLVDPQYGDPNEKPTLYLLDAETMRAAPLLPDSKDGLLDPAWSPDGSQLAFAYNPEGNYQIWILTLADGTLRQITQDSNAYRYPGWFPNP
jgi:hypothetical protein